MQIKQPASDTLAPQAWPYCLMSPIVSPSACLTIIIKCTINVLVPSSAADYPSKLPLVALKLLISPGRSFLILVEEDLLALFSLGVYVSTWQIFAKATTDLRHNLQEREDGQAHMPASEEQTLLQQLKANPKLLTSSKSIIKVCLA
jgi:hypothetical protein